MRAGADSEISTVPEPQPKSPPTAGRKPRLALFVATACGLGYLPKAPGTWGSLAGLLLAMAPYWLLFSVGAVSRDRMVLSMSFLGGNEFDPFLGMQIWLAILIAACGLWSAQRASTFWCTKDPQRVVIDEVSGQHLTLLLGLAMPIWWKLPAPPWDGLAIGLITARMALSWKYLVLGFILFRVFDIWKPFPARQAESLPGGWGIMTDDWAAAVYAGIGLWIARAAGL
ncbi:MAG TPA: phosphatidylglycerophosphatase A [Candidatus Acidoferrales bacterium]